MVFGVANAVVNSMRRTKPLAVRAIEHAGQVGHVFGVVKHLWGYCHLRDKGLAKNEAQVFSLMA